MQRFNPKKRKTFKKRQKSKLQNKCSRDFSVLWQKKQRAESAIFILYNNLLVKSVRFSTLYWNIIMIIVLVSRVVSRLRVSPLKFNVGEVIIFLRHGIPLSSVGRDDVVLAFKWWRVTKTYEQKVFVCIKSCYLEKIPRINSCLMCYNICQRYYTLYRRNRSDNKQS